MSANESIRALGSVELRTRREVILDRLRDAVIEGELAPGTHLGEIELSESLGVSRGTLREAFRHLQQEGLLVADSRGRLSVRKVTPAEVLEVFQVRGVLEGLAMQTVCALPENTREEVAQQLESAIQQMDDPGLTFAARVQADLDFHQIFLDAAGNGTLLSTWSWISGFVRSAIIAAGPGTALDNMKTERHRPFIEHIRSGDPEAGRAYVEEHMNSAATHVATALAD